MVVFHEQVGCGGTTKSYWNWLNWKSENCFLLTNFRRRHPVVKDPLWRIRTATRVGSEDRRIAGGRIIFRRRTDSTTFPDAGRRIFTIQGRERCDGQSERGHRQVNETVEISASDTRHTVCTGVEMFKKLLDEGDAGDNVGFAL
jgi:hypothetical protein